MSQPNKDIRVAIGYYLCDQCQALFFSPESLNDHMRQCPHILTEGVVCYDGGHGLQHNNLMRYQVLAPSDFSLRLRKDNQCIVTVSVNNHDHQQAQVAGGEEPAKEGLVIFQQFPKVENTQNSYPPEYIHSNLLNSKRKDSPLRTPLGESVAEHAWNSGQHEAKNTSNSPQQKTAPTTRQKNFRCPWPGCNLVFPSAPLRQDHYREHKRTKSRCMHPNCKKIISSVAQMHQHSAWHNRVKTHKCEVPGCGKVLASAQGLSEHRKAVHDNAKPYECTFPGCESRFLRPSKLQNHVNTKHPDFQRFSCDWPDCQFTTAVPKYLLQHKLGHGPQKKKN